MPDDELIDLVRDGDARALEVLIARHGEAAFSLAYRMVLERAGADDVVEDVFLALWRSGARSYDRRRGPVRAWLLGIVYGRAIERVREDNPPPSGPRSAVRSG